MVGAVISNWSGLQIKVAITGATLLTPDGWCSPPLCYQKQQGDFKYLSAIDAPTKQLIQSHSSLPVDSLTEQEQEQTLNNETKHNIVLEMLKCTILSYKIDENVEPEEVYKMLNHEQLQILKDHIERSFTNTLEDRKTQASRMPLENDERLTQCFEFDLGPYPLTPWFNKTLDDYRLEQLRKIKYFMPPKAGKENVFSIGYAECSSSLEFKPLIEPPLLFHSGLSVEDFEESVARVNKVIHPLNHDYSQNEKLIIYFVLFGITAVTALAISLGLKYHYIFPVVICIAYIIGFTILVYNVKSKNRKLLIQIHFNLALALRNENDRILMRHGIKARPGYLSKWVEYHKCEPKAGVQKRQREVNFEDEENMFSRE